MPIYEYFCPVCNAKFELLRPINKAGEDACCPRCQQSAKRAFSRFASFSKSGEGETSPIAGTGSACSSCSATSCSTCDL